PIYSPSTQIYYPSYTPSWTPARPTSPSPSSPTPPKNNPSGNTGKSKKPKKPIKAEEAKDPKDHFGINTGISKKSGDQQKLIAFINEVGKEVRNKYKNFNGPTSQYNHIVNRDIALALAYEDYSTNRLQNYFNKFGEAPSGPKSKAGRTVLANNHNDSNAKVDLSHTMTTLASTYQSGPISSGIKFISSIGLSPIGGVLPLNPFNTFTFLPNFNTSSVIQLNSLTGDLFTIMNKDDINADIDSMILSRHPKYKNLPMDKRLVTYYSEPDLDKKRKDLFFAIYSKDREEAQKKAAAEILLATMTVGGFFLVKHAKNSKEFKNAYKNIRTLDRELFDGKLEKQFQNSLPY
ncbi:hypothetical protein IR117_02130, partial [Streptococcus danieliae]|nr:hypothetical protein [Streptococcus danieliae]